MSHKAKIHAVGNYLNPLAKYLKRSNIFIANLFDGCSPFVIEGKADENIIKKYAFDIHYPLIFAKASVLNIWKDFGKRISKDRKISNQTICLDKFGKEKDIAADSQYVLVMNTSVLYDLFEYNGYLYSDIWPPNRFIKEIKAEKDTIKYSAPFFKNINWRFYYDRFIDAIQKEYDREHIILVKTNSAAWYLDSDNSIKYFDKRASRCRDFVEEVDRYFIEKTNCLCIDSHYDFIPYKNNPCLFPYAVMSEDAYKQIAECIADIVEGNTQKYNFPICEYRSPLAVKLSNNLNREILKRNGKYIEKIEKEWLPLSKIKDKKDKFFADIARLEPFLDSYERISLSDYVIDIISQSNVGEVTDADYELVELYIRYMKLNINDIIAVYMLYIRSEHSPKLAMIIDILLKNKECTAIKRSREFRNGNIEYLAKYPYITPELVNGSNGFKEKQIYIPMGAGNYITVDITDGYSLDKTVKQSGKQPDFNEISENGYVCSVTQAPLLISSVDFYIERAKKGDACNTVTVLFNNFDEFEDSLNFIDYKELLENEKFIISIADSGWKPESYSAETVFGQLKIASNHKDELEKFYKQGIEVNFDNAAEITAIKNRLGSGEETPKYVNSLCEYMLENDERILNKCSFYKKIVDYISGFRIAEKYVKNEPGTYYFIKIIHLGDVTRTMPFISYFKEYRKAVRKETVKNVVITTPNLSAYIKSFSGVDEVISIPKDQLLILNEYVKSNFSKGKIFYDSINLFKSWADENICAIYGIPEDFVHSNPEIYRFPSAAGDSSFKAADKIIEKYNTTAEKIVIFFPYAQTSSNVDVNCWSDAVKEFTEYGFTVFTNVGLGEQPLDNTIPLYEDVDIILALGQLGVILIGVQSGMMDTFMWLDIQLKIILVAFLNSEHSFRFAVNLNKRLPFYHPEPFSLDRHIQHFRGGAFIAVYTDEEKQQLSLNITEQAKYFIKGNISKDDKLFSPMKLPQISAQNLNEYVTEFMKIKDIVIFISVCDSADRYWNKFESRQLLGLKEDLSKTWRLSYVAVVDIDKNICEEKLSNNWDGIGLQYCFDDVPDADDVFEKESIKKKYGSLPLSNNCYIFSCAMDKRHYTKSSIMINGNEYSVNERGLNIAVYSKTQHRVIDSINVDTFGDPELTVRRGYPKEDKEENK